MSREAGKVVRRAGALLLTSASVASMLWLDAPGRGVIESQLLVLALFLALPA